MRVALALVIAAGCGFSASGDGPGEGEGVTIVDDTAEDFAAGVITDGIVDARGLLEPDAFIIDGLHARAFLGDLVDDADTYEQVLEEVSRVAPAGEGYRQVPADWGNLRPRGLGIMSNGVPINDGFTIFYDGEIALPAGSVMLALDVSERAIVQVALDGTTFGEPLFAHNGIAMIALEVPADGWYPIRAAYSEANGGAKFELAILETNRIPVGPERLRSRVTSHPGLVAFAFDGPGFVNPVGETARPTIAEAFGLAGPRFDLGDGRIENFSLRYAGQLRIDTRGMYTFTGTAGSQPDDGWRLWLDGEPIAQHWGIPAIDELAVTRELEPGWHDLLFDYQEANLDAQFSITMSGPDLPEGPIDPARLRPAIAGGLTASFVQTGMKTIEDVTTTRVTLGPLVAPPGATIDAVDYGFEIVNQEMIGLEVELFACHGPIALTVGQQPAYFYYPADTTCAGEAVVPTLPWALSLKDTVAGNGLNAGSGHVQKAGVAATYHGGDRIPFSPLVTFVSAPRPTPGAVRIASAELEAELRGALAEVSVRTAADPETLQAAPWIVVDGGEPVEASEWLQYKLVISSDGWQFPAVDKVTIRYVVAAD